jgi:hypothetical protein
MDYSTLTKRQLADAANAAVAAIANEPTGAFTASGYFLMSVEADAKTIKGTKRGFLTGVMYLLASTDSGVINACPYSDGCEAPCLVRSGRASFDPSIMRARLRKTLLFKADRNLFLELYARDCETLVKAAAKRDLTPVARPNGTSDFPFERFPVRGCANIMEAFPAITFYDYTKWPIRLRGRKGQLPANYSLTFSLAASARSESFAMEALRLGVNVAVVFDTRKGKALPSTFAIASGGQFARAGVVDGDESDLRFMDERGRFVGLRAKGPAIGDTTGFVRAAAAVALPTI